MQNRSPRLKIRTLKFQPIFNSSQLKSIWVDTIRPASRQQEIIDLLDFQDIHIQIEDRIKNIVSRIESGKYSPIPPVRVLLEKSKGLCRQLVIPDPIDSLILQGIISHISPSILSKRPNDRSYYLPSSGKFSGISKIPKNKAYPPDKSWLRFQKEVFKFTKSYKYIAITDISNYFDYIDFDDLRNIITSYTQIDEPITDLLIYMLESFLWTPDYSPRKPLGIRELSG